MMYGFFLYLVTTVVMVFCYPAGAITPTILPTLWTIGAMMILVGGLWFFFFLRVNVAYDGASPFHLGRADLFIGSLLASVVFALIWHFVQTNLRQPAPRRSCFSVFTSSSRRMLFVTVPSSKFAHMFFKPAVAFQRRVEEANGSSDLPEPGRRQPHRQELIAMPTYTDMTRCDGCGECVDICPSDIMHIDPVYRRVLQHRAQFLLGVLLLREGLPAERDRRSRLCRLRAARPQGAGAARTREGIDLVEDPLSRRAVEGVHVPDQHDAVGLDQGAAGLREARI